MRFGRAGSLYIARASANGTWQLKFGPAPVAGPESEP
jgi:hypothetical protein